MKKYDLDFCFKGARGYIQGPDMLNQTFGTLAGVFGSGISNLDLVFHRLTDQNLWLEVYPDGEAPELRPADVGALKFKAEDTAWQARLVEGRGKPGCRRPYDEDIVTRACKLDAEKRSVRLEEDAPHTIIETLVSMTKALHLAVFPPATVKWVFCRWSSEKWPLGDSIKGIDVRLKQTLGTRLTRSEVILGDQVVGHIYFSARSGK